MCNRKLIIALCTLFVLTMTTARQIFAPEVTATKPYDDLCLTPTCIIAASRILTTLNPKVNPCDDFYAFACGNIQKTATLLSEYSRISPSKIAEEEVQFRLLQLIENIDESSAPKHFRLVKNRYEDCMKKRWPDGEFNMDLAEQHLLSKNGWPLAYPDLWDEENFDDGLRLRSLFNFHFASDKTNNTVRLPQLQEYNPPLDRHYLKEGLSNDVVQAYYQYMVHILTAMGINRSAVAKSVNETLSMEIELYQAVFTKHDDLDSPERYSKTTLEELRSKYKNVGFPKTIRNYAGSEIQLAVDLETLDRVDKWLAGKSERLLANWQAWRSIADQVSTFGGYFRRKTHQFNRLAKGVSGEKAEWKQCVDETQKLFGFALAALYQRKWMTERAADDLIAMFNNMKQQFSKFVQKAAWLDVDTKRKALEKVENITSSLSVCRDLILDEELERFYRNVTYEPNSRNENLLRAMMDELLTNNVHASSRIHCGRFFMKSQYSLQFNFVHLAAKLYTDVFHDVDRPKYLNYGAAGRIIGHKIAHSFGIRGRHYDKNGNLMAWSSSESNEIFINNSRCFIDQYGNYSIDEFKIHVNGLATQIENFADNVGVKIAYHAYVDWANATEPEKTLPGLDYSPNQMFWISMANSYCINYKPEYLRANLRTDNHAPNKFRVNGPVSNSPEFSHDFKCNRDAKMNPQTKCNSW